MKKINIIFIIAAVAAVAGWWYFMRGDESSLPAGISQAKIEAQQKQTEDFEKRLTDADGKVNKTEVDKYLNGQIAEAMAALSKTSPGTPEREKLERRIMMLTRMRERQE
jgi:hypothetical protein